jgi:signal transduction histidine kinase
MTFFNSLAGRLVVSLVVVSLAAQVVTITFFARQQEFNERNNRERQFIRRSETAADVIYNFQANERRNALRSFNSRDMDFAIDPAPIVTDEDVAEGNITALPPNLRAHRMPDPRSVWEKYFAEATAPPPEPPRFRPPNEQSGLRDGPRGPRMGGPEFGPRQGGPEGRRPPMGSAERPVAVKVSIPLSDGEWLNARMEWPDRPPAWVVPFLSQTVIALLGMALVVVVLVRTNTRGLKKLAEVAERIGRGDDTEPLAETGPSEIKSTARAFNTMTAQLKRMIQGRTRMLAGISHDLRTPITALRIRAELMDDGENRDRMLATLDEMQALAEATLTLAKQDAGQGETQTVDLAALAESVCDDLADVGQPVGFAAHERLLYPCRAVGMKRALRNLVENAVKYGVRADVSLALDAEHVLILVDDAGPGIPEDQLKRLFQPFVRLEESRSKETGGFGLGLTIARAIVQGHGGDITLENRTGGGLRATIKLPRVSVAN